MTGREVTPNPSAMIEIILKPFAQVSQNPTFAGLSHGMRLRVYQTVLEKAIDDLKNVLREVLGDERKMHDSLQKFKKTDEGEGGNLSDFDKMRIQFFIDLSSLKSQITSLDPGSDQEENKIQLQLESVFEMIMD